MSEDKFDLKAESLKQFGKKVQLILRPGSESFLKYGNELKGVLVGRTWGDRYVSEARTIQSVIAVTICTECMNEVSITYNDIQDLKESPGIK